MSAITYYTATGQSAFNVATTIGNPVWEDAIPELNAKIVFNQPFMQLAVSYSPLALNTQYPAQGTSGVPASPTYYLVGESGHSDKKAGLIEWNRTYARVPDPWSDTQEFAFTYPAFSIPITVGSTAAIVSISAQGSTTYYVISTTLTGVTVGDQVYISCSYVRSGATYGIAMAARAVLVSSGNYVCVPYMLPGTGDFISESGTIQLFSAARAVPKTMIVSSRIQHDYALSTAEQLESNLPLIDGFRPTDTVGNEVSTLSTGAATRPNSEAYQKWMISNAEIVAETSTRERWRGNIWVRKTRLVPAK
jgi:hypothetical protein